MANKIQLKRSTQAAKVPLTADLEAGELAINLTDFRLYAKDASSAVRGINDWNNVFNKPSGLAPATDANTAETLVKRDASGNFAAGAITLAGAPTANLHAATKQYVDQGAAVWGNVSGTLSAQTDLQSALDAKTTNNDSTTVVGNWTFSNPVTIASATQATHAVTKQYVDEVAEGLKAKPAAKAATTANLVGTYDNGVAGVGATLNLGPAATLTIDATTVWAELDGVLVKDQTNKAHNGRYFVSQIGDASTDWILTRCFLCDEANEIPGAYVFVFNGGINAGTGWVQLVDNPDTFVVGTHDIDVIQFSGAGTYTAGAGLTLTGTQFALTSGIVTPGTYAKLTVDTYGRVTTGTTLVAADIPSLDTSKITTGELANARTTGTSANTANTLVLRDASGNFSAGVITATTTAARYADLAENYVADAQYAPGTVVEFGGAFEVTAATQLTRKVAGVISTNPAHLMNSECEGEFVVALALQGRVPCKVIGTVRKGDSMVAAGNGRARAWGYATYATRDEGLDPRAGTVIGKAIEDFAGGEGVIEVLVGRL